MREVAAFGLVMADFVPELLVEELASPEYMGFYSANGNSQHFGDLFIASFLTVPEKYHPAVLLGELVDRLFEEKGTLVADELLVGFVGIIR